jgi:hypothetical protein
VVWTTPRTADTNEIWTSSDWNTYVRDNQNESMPATLTAALQYAVADGNHNLVARAAQSATVATPQNTALTSYTDLTTVGPQVATLSTGTRALALYTAQMSNNTDSLQCRISCAVSGATTIAADDDWCALMDGVTLGNTNRFGAFKLFDTLNVGSNTFTMKYRVGGGTGTFVDRHLIVVPF